MKLNTLSTVPSEGTKFRRILRLMHRIQTRSDNAVRYFLSVFEIVVNDESNLEYIFQDFFFEFMACIGSQGCNIHQIINSAKKIFSRPGLNFSYITLRYSLPYFNVFSVTLNSQTMQYLQNSFSNIQEVRVIRMIVKELIIGYIVDQQQFRSFSISLPCYL